jgi:1-acyl-sn-glycerol-3-phosphate acyltransferase
MCLVTDSSAAEKRPRWPNRAFRWLYQPYKFLVVAPMLGVLTFVFASLAVILCLFIRPRVVSAITGVPWARLNALLTPMRVRVSGRENIDPDQSYVVVSNHQSHYDIFVLYGFLGIDFRWIMKQELRKVPGIGVSCYRLGHIFIDRSNHAAALASIEAAKKRVTPGTSVVFFPEGTRSRSNRLRAFKKGAFHFARDLEVPVLPVTIVGTRDVLPSDSIDLKPGRAQLIIHPPVAVEGGSRDEIAELMGRVRDTIAAPLGSE